MEHGGSALTARGYSENANSERRDTYTAGIPPYNSEGGDRAGRPTIRGGGQRLFPGPRAYVHAILAVNGIM